MSVRSASWLLVVSLLTGCQTPFLTLPGGALQGPVEETDSFAFATGYQLLQLEVRPDEPYSVFLRVVMRGDQLYVDAAEHRRWHEYLREDNHVRVKLGDVVYPATCVVVDDPKALGGFLPGRTIYRIEPRRE